MTQGAHRVPPKPLLTVERQQIGWRVVLAVTGEVDLASAPSLRSAIDSALDAGAQELWIDLSTATFLDSAGVHLLIAAREQADDLRRRLAVICPPGPVRRVLDLTGATDALPLYEDRGAAHRDG